MIFFYFFSNFGARVREIHGGCLDRGMPAHRLAACTVKLPPQGLRWAGGAPLAGGSAALPGLPATEVADKPGARFQVCLHAAHMGHLTVKPGH